MIWIMARDRNVTTQAPLVGGAAVVPVIELVRVAHAMGLEPEPLPPRLDLVLVRRIATAAAHVGIGRDAAIALRTDPLPMTRVPALVSQLTESLRASPLPRQELERLTATLDLDTIGRIVGASPMSLRRYLAGSRETPDDVAARIHWLALTTHDLLGAYNAIGVRRWFERPRSTLGDRRPLDILTDDWDPDDAAVMAIRALASALTHPGWPA
jgi:uncharacterized protein (DUF2384 family)